MDLTASVSTIASTVQNVSFSSSRADIAALDPTSDTTEPYSTRIFGLSAGDSIITVTASLTGSSVTCSVTAPVTILSPGPWWQAEDADITTNYYLSSIIPSSATNNYLILAGKGGYPGIPLYNGILDLGFGTVSLEGWSVNSPYSTTKSYNYASLVRQIPSTVTFNLINKQSITETDLMSPSAFDDSRGYYWFSYNGAEDLSIDSDINLGTRKVILLVDKASLYINGKINLTDGVGFFAALVGETDSDEKGSIYIDPLVGGAIDAVPELEGIYFADNQFRTGLGNTQLHVRGSVASYGGVVMERDIVNDNLQNPAEYFEFAPDQILLIPPELNTKRYQWKEVAP